MDTCTDCGAPATCRYDYGTGPRLACAGHDPLRPYVAAMVRVPSFYQSLPRFPVLATTGHLSVCTSGPWNAVIPPPPCPAHGQAQMLQVTC